MTGKSKEVEEWLMGSGESSETAASMGLKGSLSFKLVQGDKKTEAIIEDPIQEAKEDEWMFRTFSKKQKSPATPYNNEVSKPPENNSF
jgi:DNA-binding ferritin-like protein